MTELERAASTDTSVKAYLSEVRKLEIKLKEDMLDAIHNHEKPEKSLAVKRDKANIKRFLNLARTIQKRHNKNAKTYKINTLERIIAEGIYDYSRQVLSKIEFHSTQVIEGMRRRRSVFYTKEDIDMIVKPPSEEELERLRNEERENEEALVAEQKEIGQRILNQYLSTKIPDLTLPPEMELKEESEEKKENGAT